MNRKDDTDLQHRRTWDSIPWLVNGDASDDERLAAEAHLRACADCRTELEFQRRLYAGINAQPESMRDPRASLHQLWKRIDAAEATPVVLPVDGAPSRRRRLLRLLASVAAAEAVALVILGTVWRQPSPNTQAPASYHTLGASAAPVPAAEIRAVFAPALTLEQFQGLLASMQLRVVAGPSESGVYSLVLTTAHDDAAAYRVLAKLRAEPAVRFAEPIGALAAPSP